MNTIVMNKYLCFALLHNEIVLWLISKLDYLLICLEFLRFDVFNQFVDFVVFQAFGELIHQENHLDLISLFQS
jgi:hypothetical protein